jgi:[ribosomal protein S5]-alanine N-acetyltransferase
MIGLVLVTPTVQTDRLVLRPFVSTDTDAVFAVRSKSIVMRYWDSPPWTERAQAERFIATCKDVEEEGSGLRLAVERKLDSGFVGWCLLVNWNPEFRSATIGYGFDDSVWGQGFATEAVTALVGWAFESLDLNRVQAETDTRNTGSCRVLEKLGFVREGLLREDCVVNGDVSDSYVYGLLRREWQ